MFMLADPDCIFNFVAFFVIDLEKDSALLHGRFVISKGYNFKNFASASVRNK